MKHTLDKNGFRDPHRQTMHLGDTLKSPNDDTSSGNASRNTDEQTVIPLIREELSVKKRVVETCKRMRVKKSASERVEIVDEALVKEEAFIERVAVNEMIEGAAMPTTRHEGRTMIIPILEEVLVIEKRTMLKEELRVTHKRSEFHEPQRFVLRTDQISVEHFNDSFEPSDDVEAQE